MRERLIDIVIEFNPILDRGAAGIVVDLVSRGRAGGALPGATDLINCLIATFVYEGGVPTPDRLNLGPYPLPTYVVTAYEQLSLETRRRLWRLLDSRYEEVRILIRGVLYNSCDRHAVMDREACHRTYDSGWVFWNVGQQFSHENGIGCCVGRMPVTTAQCTFWVHLLHFVGLTVYGYAVGVSMTQTDHTQGAITQDATAIDLARTYLADEIGPGEPLADRIHEVLPDWFASMTEYCRGRR